MSVAVFLLVLDRVSSFILQGAGEMAGASMEAEASVGEEVTAGAGAGYGRVNSVIFAV